MAIATDTAVRNILPEIKSAAGRKGLARLVAGDVVKINVNCPPKIAVFEGILSDGRFSFVTMRTSEPLKGEITQYQTTREYINPDKNGTIYLSPLHTKVDRLPPSSLEYAPKIKLFIKAGLN